MSNLRKHLKIHKGKVPELCVPNVASVSVLDMLNKQKKSYNESFNQKEFVDMVKR